MRNILGLKIETKISLTIIALVAIIMIIAVIKSTDGFDNFLKKINSYEELRIQQGQ